MRRNDYQIESQERLNTMKLKRIILLLAAMFLLAACAKGADAPEAQSVQTPASTAEATETPAGNPFFTCTGTEYGDFPTLRPEKREAEAKAFLTEHRELLERAATDWPDQAHFSIFDGEARFWDEQERGYVTVDAATLPESLQALVALSEKTGIDFYRTGPEPVFTEDAAPFFEVCFPRAIDTTYQDPGILYEVWLIYTENTAEQIRYSKLEPLAENWYIEVYFYAY